GEHVRKICGCQRFELIEARFRASALALVEGEHVPHDGKRVFSVSRFDADRGAPLELAPDVAPRRAAESFQIRSFASGGQRENGVGEPGLPYESVSPECGV